MNGIKFCAANIIKTNGIRSIGLFLLIYAEKIAVVRGNIKYVVIRPKPIASPLCMLSPQTRKTINSIAVTTIEMKRLRYFTISLSYKKVTAR